MHTRDASTAFSFTSVQSNFAQHDIEVVSRDGEALSREARASQHVFFSSQRLKPVSILPLFRRPEGPFDSFAIAQSLRAGSAPTTLDPNSFLRSGCSLKKMLA
jgi:hypothetical protein